MDKHGAAWCFLPSTDFSFFLSLLFFSFPPLLPHTPLPAPPFFFLFFTGFYFYTHPPFREFLKLYFPHYQRGLRLKKPMVPPQSLTLVFSNTSKLLPTCSYSSIQPFSHQVSAARCLFLGREKGEFRKKYARRKPGSRCVEVLAWWLLPGAGRCPAQAAASLQPVVPGEPQAEEMLAAGRGCWLLAASLGSWVGVFQSNTKISIMLCHPKSESAIFSLAPLSLS